MILSTHDSLENFNKLGPAPQLVWESLLDPRLQSWEEKGWKRHTHVYNNDTTIKTALSETRWHGVWDRIWSQLHKLWTLNQDCTCSAMIWTSFFLKIETNSKDTKVGAPSCGKSQQHQGQPCQPPPQPPEPARAPLAAGESFPEPQHSSFETQDSRIRTNPLLAPFFLPAGLCVAS